MALKKESTREVATYELILTHADIVDIMNDTQVQLNEGNVVNSQTFNLYYLPTSGNEVSLREFNSGDKISFRFNIVTLDSTSSAIGDLDVT